MRDEHGYKDWMTEDQRKCWRMACDLYGGPHHIYGKVESYGEGIRLSVADHDFATYDTGMLTGLVILAHDRGIRASLHVANFGRMYIELFVRHYRTGGNSWDRHPTLEQQIQWKRRPSDDDMPVDLAAKGGDKS